MLVGLPTAQAADTTLTLACQGTATDITQPVDGNPEPTSMASSSTFARASHHAPHEPVEVDPCCCWPLCCCGLRRRSYCAEAEYVRHHALILLSYFSSFRSYPHFFPQRERQKRKEISQVFRFSLGSGAYPHPLGGAGAAGRSLPNHSFNFSFTVRSGTTRMRHRTMAEFASARFGNGQIPHSRHMSVLLGRATKSMEGLKTDGASGTSPSPGLSVLRSGCCKP
jgi:hypothetical protein